MLNYNPRLKQNARRLRTDMTDAERLLWSHLRRKQVGGVQFYRQKPIANFIVDFYAPMAGLVIEVDGAEHMDADHRLRDARRDACLNQFGLQVLRFTDRQVLQEIDGVMEAVYLAVKRVVHGNPP